MLVPPWVPLIGGQLWSGMRVHVFGTWLAVIIAIAVSVPMLHDTVAIPLDAEERSLSAMQSSPPPPIPEAEVEQLRAQASEPDIRRGYMVRRVARAAEAPSTVGTGDGGGGDSLACLTAVRSPCELVTVVSARLARAWASTIELCVLRSFWRALWLSVCLFWISKQWGDMDQLLPPFLERYYGEAVPYYAIHSINMWIGMFGPSLAAALTMHLDAFDVMLPGLWIMAIAPGWLALEPSIEATVCWVTLLSIGEVLWSPRLSAWIASVAPDGREGIFLAMLSLKTLITAIPSTSFNGWINAAYNPNCASCRDTTTGHFCAEPVRLNSTAVGCRAPGASHPCVGPEYSSALVAPHFEGLHCPTDCHGCPGWEGHAQTMWLIVLVSSLSSPILVSASLRFLRDDGSSASPK